MKKIAVLTFIWFIVTSGGSVMAEDIFIHSHHPLSGRFAILDDNQTVAFLYLTARGTQKPEKDAIAYMRVPPPEGVDWQEMAKQGEPPLLPKELATSGAVLENPTSSQFSFQWSENGEAAVLLHNGRPIALVSATETRGYSRAVAKENRLTNPWNQQLYESLFAK
jgi:hypothetical protein